MLDDSHLDLLSHIESKILVNMGADHWAPELREKVKEAKNVVFETRFSKNLNPECFYEKN